MQNPLTKPEGDEKEISMEWFSSKIQNGSLKFYDCMDKLRIVIDSSNKKLAMAYGYYTINIVINSEQIENKETIIALIVTEIENINLESDKMKVTECENIV